MERGKWHPGYLVVGLRPRDVVKLDALPAGEDDSVLAEWGSQMHLAKEGSPGAADPWESWMTPHRERLWPEGLGVHERAWAYDCRTGLVTLAPGGVDKDVWKKSRGPNDITGTTDWDAVLPSGEPWVDDLKTGWMKPGLTTPQMLMYALVASKVAEYDTVRVSVTHWRRGWEDPNRYWQQVGPATLGAFEDEVREAWKRAVGRNPAPKDGPHCKYCPSAAVCPTVVGDAKD